MKFHLNYTPTKSGFEINHTQTLFLAGSCFSENIGNLLQQHKFKIKSNPSGILFNPLSIYNALTYALQQKELDEKYILQRGATFLSYLHHSSVNAPTKNELLEQVNSENTSTHAFLQNADHLIITFGSAFYYGHNHLETAVANCHKQPANVFEKRLMEITEIVNLYSDLIEKLKLFNPKLKLTFTVSPVKHLKDGVVENNISKSILLLSVQQLVKQFDHCFYFPAYELVNDDLRDYRFYKADMAHPNDMAIDYVWQKFSACFFSDKTNELNRLILKLNSALNHRGLHENNEETAKLKEFILKQKEEILKLEPEIVL